MDRFKAVNDIHGHAAGDLLLQAFAKRVLGCVRKQDAVARLGGDEFAVILESVGHAAAARSVATDILCAVGQRFHFEGMFAESVECDAAEKACGDDAIGVDVIEQQWNGGCGDRANFAGGHG